MTNSPQLSPNAAGRPATLKERAREHRARKSFGQNFLIDEKLLTRIVDAMQCSDLDKTHVLEIGCGLGFLTDELLNRGYHVTALDIDPQALQRVIPSPRLTKHHADALTFDLASLPTPLTIMGNLPFHVANKILINITGELHERDWRYPDISEMILMFQLEVGERLAAKPSCKAYNALSILMQSKCQVDYLFDVPAQAFLPRPKIDAAVVRITPRLHPAFHALEETERKKLSQMIRTAFQARRKNLKNALKPLYPGDKLEAAFAHNNLSVNLRAENLQLDDFIALLKALS